MNLYFMKPIYQALYALALGALLGGCSDFLEGKSKDQIIVTTAKDYGELLYGSGYPQTTPALLTENMTDDVDWMVEKPQNEKQNIAANEGFMAAYSWQPYLYEYGTKVEFTSTEYYQVYDRIKGCNAVLDGIDEAIGTQYERDRVKAEALAVRAYHYLMLVNLYGEPYTVNPQAPGVPLKLTADIEEEGIPRNTVEEVYGQIIADLEEAIGLLKPYEVTEQDYHINLPAMYTLLSRVCLYMGRWEETVEEATEALKINNRLYDLTVIDPDMENFMPNSYNSPEVYWCFGSTMFEQTKQVSQSFIDAFDENDVRYDLENGLYVRGVQVADPNGGWGAPMIYNGSFSLPKCNNAVLNADGSSSGQTLPSLSIRASEAYLNRAEAYAMMPNHKSDALNDLNKVCKNRIIGYQELTENDVPDVLEAVRAERRREFCFEGFRWFDLRRYGMPRIIHSYQINGPTLYYILQEKDPMYTLPIPSTVIELNPELEQNPSAGMSARSTVSIY